MHIFNSTPLYVLDICEVCGSYQCPYCPYFSSAPPTVAMATNQLISIVMTSIVVILSSSKLFLSHQ